MNLLKHQELHRLESKHFIQKARDLAPHLCDTSDEELKFKKMSIFILHQHCEDNIFSKKLKETFPKVKMPRHLIF